MPRAGGAASCCVTDVRVHLARGLFSRRLHGLTFHLGLGLDLKTRARSRQGDTINSINSLGSFEVRSAFCKRGFRTEKQSGGSVFVADEAQGMIVRRIFAEYVSGMGCKEIAKGLNRDGVATPKPRAHLGNRPAWAPTAIHSMLRNPIYRGELVWGKSEWRKNHETGKRKRFDVPESQWVRSQVPAIIDADLWQAAQDEMVRRGALYDRSTDGRRIKTHHARNAKRESLLAGFLECAECGGSFSSLNRATRYGCQWHRERGDDACASGLVLRRDDLESVVVGAMRDHLLTEHNVAYLTDQALRHLEMPSQKGDTTALQREIDRVGRQLLLAAKEGRDVLPLASRLRTLEADLRKAQTPRERIKTNRARLRQRVMDAAEELRDALTGAGLDEARAALRTLLHGQRFKVGPGFSQEWVVDGLVSIPAAPPRVGGLGGPRRSGGALWPYRTAPQSFATDFPVAA